MTGGESERPKFLTNPNIRSMFAANEIDGSRVHPPPSLPTLHTYNTPLRQFEVRGKYSTQTGRTSNG